MNKVAVEQASSSQNLYLRDLPFISYFICPVVGTKQVIVMQEQSIIIQFMPSVGAIL